jgi:uncharacterized protein with PIN domain
MVCNGLIKVIDKKDINQKLSEKTIHSFEDFYRCSNCSKIYWKGSHYKKMKKTITNLIE